MKKYQHVSLIERVRRYVCAHSERTAKQVTAAVGRYVSEASAVAAGRAEQGSYNRLIDRGVRHGKPRENVPAVVLAERGRRKIIATALSMLSRREAIVRLGKGRYGPPALKIHNPKAS